MSVDMGDWKKNGNWAPPMLIMAFGILVAIIFARAYDFAYFCPTNEVGNLTVCAREWISAAGGYFATVIAGVTVVFLWKQIKQTDEHRREDQRREARLVADMLLIDLLQTAERIRSVGDRLDLEPPLADLSRQMIRDAVKVTPILAVALQKHCAEVAQFANNALKNFTSVGMLLPPYVDERRYIAFRATILSYCFGTASQQIAETGEANGPFITADALANIERQYGVDPQERAYLDYVLKVAGIG